MRFFLFQFVTIGVLISLSCTKSVTEVDRGFVSSSGGDLVLGSEILPNLIYHSKGVLTKLVKAGLKDGDKILISTEKGKEIELELKDVDNSAGSLKLPDDFVDGVYLVQLVREHAKTSLGYSKFSQVFNANIPDKMGMNIKGLVRSTEGNPIPNVMVSDGFGVTLTDKDGVYYLSSDKSNGYVFISMPSGYEVKAVGNIPTFFKYLIGNSRELVEIHDFELTPVENDKHSLLVMTDFHLANRTNDLLQFETGFVKDVNKEIESLRSQGRKVYGLTLGDLGWEDYWVANKFALPEFLVQSQKIHVPMFHAIGNHDNDPYAQGDWNTEKLFKRLVGPTYYSFNLGKVHYVVLDNIEYINNGGSVGIKGDYAQNAKIVDRQLDWLKRDLQLITDKSTPVVVAIHIQLNNTPVVGANGKMQPNSPAFRMIDAQKFLDCFAGFEQVHILSGHQHTNHTFANTEQIMEHNIGAVCATWWWTGKANYSGEHIGRDGAPGGYAVWEMDGKNLKWYYKGIDKDRSYQFRAYDLNKVQITASKYAPNTTQALLNEYTQGYEKANTANEILVNVWGQDEAWKVEMNENNKPLVVSRLSAYDPLHIISYPALRLNEGYTPTSTYLTTRMPNFFKAKASSATSTIEIKVTDRFGNVYTETMKRPKDFGFNMQ